MKQTTRNSILEFVKAWRYLISLLLLLGITLSLLRPQDAFWLRNDLDDACYLQHAALWLGEKMDICQSTSYPPGQGLLFIPAAALAKIISNLTGSSFLGWLQHLMGVQSFLLFIATQFLLWRILSLMQLWNQAVRFLIALSIPIIFYATSRTYLPTIHEAFLTAMFLYLCIKEKALASLFIFALLCLTRWNLMPLILVWWAFHIKGLLPKEKKDHLPAGIAVITCLALAIPTVHIAMAGHNTDTLWTVLRNISWNRFTRVFVGSDWGLMWMSPLWIIVLAAALLRWRQITPTQGMVLLFVLIQLVLTVGWRGNGGSYAYRYLTSSYVLLLMFWPALWNACNKPAKGIVAALLVLQTSWVLWTSAIFMTAPELTPVQTSDLHGYTENFQIHALQKINRKPSSNSDTTEP